MVSAATRTALIAALAIAVPVAGAGAATAAVGDPGTVVVGPTLINDVFNGNTTIIVAPGPVAGTSVESR
jgi:hypothetical protein